MEKFAFFDVDETVIRFKSMFLFNEYYCKNVGVLPSLFGGLRHRIFMRLIQSYWRDGRSREFINALYYHRFKGRKRSTVRELSWRWYNAMRNEHQSIYNPAALNIIRRHQENRTKIVLVSGSFEELLEPIAEELGVDRVLATQLEVSRGRYTGKIVPPQMIGAGKALAVRTLLAAEGANRADAWAYGDHTSDIAMLEEVDHPTIVSSDKRMIEIAMERGWPIVDPLGDARVQQQSQEMTYA